MQRGSTLFVGRGHELEQLRARLERAFAGGGTVTALVGEPGIGKTSIALAFAEQARARGALVLRGTCIEGESVLPLHPWAEMVREAVRALGKSRVAKALGATAAPLGAFVPSLAPRLRDRVPLDPREERFRLYDAVAELLLHAATEAPVVLVFEDLHWADSDTVSLLRHVARFSARARWVMLATYREAEVDPRAPLADLLATLRRETDYQRIALRGFALPEVTEVLTRSAGRELPPPIVRLIFDETVGNPFYVREVFRHLLEEGKIAARDGAWSGAVGMRELGIPAGVRELVGRRLSRLSDETVRVLEVASALMGPADFATLLPLCELDEEALATHLDEALAAGFLRAEERRTYDFAHAIVRRTIYDGQNHDRRTRLHRRIAVALEADEARAPKNAAQIAAQYEASSLLAGSEQGVPHAMAAAAEAYHLSAHDRAVTLLRLARDLASTAPAHVRVAVLRALALAEAMARLGDDACLTVEATLREMEAASAPRDEVAAFLAEVARALKSNGAVAATWEPLVARGLAATGKKRDLVWARLKLLEERVEPLASGAVHVIRMLGRDAQATRILRERGDEDDYVSTLEYAYRTRSETESLVALSKTWGHPGAVLRALDAASRDLIYRHGEFREARALLRQMLEVSEACGSIAGQAEAHVQLAHCHAALGEVEDARRVRARAHALVARLGAMHRQHVAPLGLDTMHAYYFGGDWAAIAQPAARFAADPSTARSPVAHLAAGLAVLAYALAGYAKESRSLLSHLAPVFERCDLRVYNYGVALDCALIAVWHLGASDLAERYLALAEQAPRDAGTAPFSVRCLNVARMRVLLGDVASATEAIARAKEMCAAGSLRPLRAIALHDEAASLLRADDADLRPHARDLLAEALPEFRDLAMEPWVAHTHQLLGVERPSAPGASRARRSRRRSAP